MQRRLFLAFALTTAVALTLPALASAQPAPTPVDPERAARSTLVVRATLDAFHGGSKYHRSDVKVTAVFENRSGAPVPDKLAVAHYGWAGSLPERGAFTLYLVPYADGLWFVLDKDCKVGVSHATAPPATP